MSFLMGLAKAFTITYSRAKSYVDKIKSPKFGLEVVKSVILCQLVKIDSIP